MSNSRFFALGMCFLLISSPPLFLMAIETLVGSYAFNRYEICQVLRNKIDFHGHSIELRDSLRQRETTPDERFRSKVSVLIDNKDYSSNTGVIIRPAYTDSNRYAGQISLVLLTDKGSGESKMTVTQALPGGRAMILLIDAEGRVAREVFPISKKLSPIYRAMLVQFVQPVATGIVSDVLHVYPSLLYPVIYPFATGGLGLILTALGLGGLAIRKYAKGRQ